MADATTNRKLAAIVAADVVGYSRMMGADEGGTLEALKRHREEEFNPAVARHNGRIVKLIGDGTLVEFGSVVDAVNCALEIQRTIAATGAERAIKLRIGINLGDVIIDGDDIYGDGVNIAARLEGLAEPGGVCLASIVNESVAGRVEATFEDGGEVEVKNIARPIRVWRWQPSAAEVSAAGTPPSDKSESRTMITGSETRSIAVLPFSNMSGDAEQEYFSDGITEDIITDLSKVGGLTVIARNSTFAYKGKSIDIRAVGRELGVTSVLEGSVRRAGNRVRVTAQLIDATSGGHVWADRYDRDLTDIFEVQDEVTREIVSALKVSLTPREAALIGDAPTTSVEAHDLYAKSREMWRRGLVTQATIIEVRSMLQKAIELDPAYGEPHAALTMTYILEFNNNWTDDPEGAIAQAREHAREAVRLAPKVAIAHTALATVFGFTKEYGRARESIRTALELSPSSSDALFSLGATSVMIGKLDEAIQALERVRRVDPGGSVQALHFLGLAYLFQGRYEAAAVHFKERILLQPGTDLSRVMLASTLGHLNQSEEARRIWDELMEINPDYSFKVHMSRLPFVNEADRQRISDGLLKAGLVSEEVS